MAIIMMINNKHCFRNDVIMIILLLLVFIPGCQTLSDNGQENSFQDQPGVEEGEGIMELNEIMPQGDVPPIDLKLPANLETATFGMG